MFWSPKRLGFFFESIFERRRFFPLIHRSTGASKNEANFFPSYVSSTHEKKALIPSPFTRCVDISDVWEDVVAPEGKKNLKGGSQGGGWGAGGWWLTPPREKPCSTRVLTEPRHARGSSPLYAAFPRFPRPAPAPHRPLKQTSLGLFLHPKDKDTAGSA